MKVLIIGCGYLGTRLANGFAKRGHEVLATRRQWSGDAESLGQGVCPIVFDLADENSYHRLPTDIDWIVNCASSSRGGVEAYQRVFAEGSRRLVDWLRDNPVKKLLFTSSTSVYGQTSGDWVDEESTPDPSGPLAPILLKGESLLLDGVTSATTKVAVMRLAGIYGPGRGYLFWKYVAGEATLSDRPERWLNMVHVNDCKAAILHWFATSDQSGVFNLADDLPVREDAFYRWLDESLGLGMPQPLPNGSAPKKRKRAFTNKRVSNEKIKKVLGYSFFYPSFRDGYQSEIENFLADRSGPIA